MSQVKYPYAGAVNAPNASKWTETIPHYRQQVLQQDFNASSAIGSYNNYPTCGGMSTQSQVSQITYPEDTHGATSAGCLQKSVMNAAITATSDNVISSQPQETSQLLHKTYAELRATSDWQENI
jgi:hypothetical protein